MTRSIALLLTALAAGPAAAQVVYPPPPDSLAVTVRYRTRPGQADRDPRRPGRPRALDRTSGSPRPPRDDADLDIFDDTPPTG